MKESEKRPYTLVLDEFQEFDRTNPGVYGDIQHIWDEYHNKTKLNLVVNGSINRLMNKSSATIPSRCTDAIPAP